MKMIEQRTWGRHLELLANTIHHDYLFSHREISVRGRKESNTHREAARILGVLDELERDLGGVLVFQHRSTITFARS